MWGAWSKCSASCDEGIQYREYRHFSGICPFSAGDQQFQACMAYACPTLSFVETHDAHYTPDPQGVRSTMFLHFTTTMNYPWHFEEHDINIHDSEGKVSSITARSVSEDCSSVTQKCLQEWELEYVTEGKFFFL